MPQPALGHVALIGAGPGDPGLLTLRGLQQLRRADVVLYDYLVDPRVLHACRDEAQRICLGRHRDGRAWEQSQINARMIAEAQAGRFVARLKGGDPAIFGRLSEEIAALEAAGIPYEVTPGVTAASAACAYAGIPLTHRDHASCVALITGQQQNENPSDPLDYGALAAFPGTLAFYMGVTTAADWSQALIAHGKSASTPVALVRHASRPHQQTIVTTLGALPEALAPGTMRPPIVALVGPAVAARAGFDWFGRRPLAGQRVLVTRPRGQEDGMVEAFADRGACVWRQPAIEIAPPDDWGPVDAALAALPETDWAVFSSANGVEALLGRLLATGGDLRALGGVRLAAIGPATAAALLRRGLRADATPAAYCAESLAAALRERLAAETPSRRRPPRVLLVRASRGREVLAEQLRAGGAEVFQAVAYVSRDTAEPDPQIRRALEAGEIDWITVTSSAIARSLARMFGPALRRARLAAISPLTAAALAEAGFAAAAIAATYDADGVVAAVEAAVQEGAAEG